MNPELDTPRKSRKPRLRKLPGWKTLPPKGETLDDRVRWARAALAQALEILREVSNAFPDAENDFYRAVYNIKRMECCVDHAAKLDEGGVTFKRNGGPDVC